MKEKNGFVFVETIVVVVILTSSLLLLYSTFNKLLQSEKTRTYYDDISYIYRTWYLQRVIRQNNILLISNELATTDNKYFVTVGSEYSNLFENNKSFFEKMYSDFEVKQIVFVKTNKLTDLKNCTQECADNKEECTNGTENEQYACNQVYTNLSADFITYLKSVYIDVNCAYFMAVEYETCDVIDETTKECHKYYSWVSVM